MAQRPRWTRTIRGFRTCEKAAKTCHQMEASISLTESSLAGTHPHLWIRISGDCKEHLGQHLKPSPHLGPHQVRRLRDALTDWLVQIGAEEKS